MPYDPCTKLICGTLESKREIWPVWPLEWRSASTRWHCETDASADRPTLGLSPATRDRIGLFDFLLLAALSAHTGSGGNVISTRQSTVNPSSKRPGIAQAPGYSAPIVHASALGEWEEVVRGGGMGGYDDSVAAEVTICAADPTHLATQSREGKLQNDLLEQRNRRIAQQHPVTRLIFDERWVGEAILCPLSFYASSQVRNRIPENNTDRKTRHSLQ